MATYTAGTDSMVQAVEDMNAVTAKLDSSVQDLLGSLRAYVADNHGDAADAYSSAQQTLNAGVDDMKNALTVGSNRLDDIVDNYRRTDRNGAQILA